VQLFATFLLFILGAFNFPTSGAQGRLAAQLDAARVALCAASLFTVSNFEKAVMYFSMSGILLDPAKLVSLVFADRVIKI
jgi:hypothetical protein